MKIYSRIFGLIVIIGIFSPQVILAQDGKNMETDTYNYITINATSQKENYVVNKDELDTVKNKLEKQMDKIKGFIGISITEVSALSYLEQSEAQYISHRGANYIAPENTIPAFESAGKLGYKYIETDIQLTSDGNWVIMHDFTVDRMTNGKGTIANMTLAEIKTLNIDAGNNVDLYPNTKVPTLEEYLVICKKYDIKPFIEIKNVPANNEIDGLLFLLEKYGVSEKFDITASNWKVLQYIRNKNESIRLALIVNYFDQDVLNICQYTIGDCMLSLEQTYATQENIKKAHLYGVKVAVWTVVSDVLRDEYVSYGADFIITDNLK